jgi:hypothetical protein
MLNLLVLHQELVCSIIDASDLINIPRLPHSNLGQDVPFAFLRV